MSDFLILTTWYVASIGLGCAIISVSGRWRRWREWLRAVRRYRQAQRDYWQGKRTWR